MKKRDKTKVGLLFLLVALSAAVYTTRLIDKGMETGIFNFN